MAREAQTVCFAQDLLLQGRISAACDVLTQRLKGLEQISGGGHFSVAQRLELVPTDVTLLSSPVDTLEASRLQREELRARTAASRPWEKRTEWEKRSEENRGKSKGKETKGKGKGKGDSNSAHKGGKEEERHKK